MATDNTQDNAGVARDLYEAFNKHEFDRAADTMTATNLEWVNVPLGITFEGPEGYKQFVGGWASAMPDSRVEVQRVIANGDSVVAEFAGRGTHIGLFSSPAGDIQPTGRQVELQFCEVLQLKNGKVVRAHTYFDSITLLRQLGVVA